MQNPSATPGTAPFARLTIALALAAVAACFIIAFTAPDPFYLAPFRESQTAISAYYLVHEPAGGMFAYQTPVLGLPWRLPLEFPLFQQLTAWVAAGGMDVALAGRLVSLAGFLGCLVVVSRIWKDCRLPAPWLGVALALFAASPVYIFYATSHMIESWALLTALIFLWCAFRFAENGGWLWVVILAVSAALSAMVKITTWLPSAFLVSLLLLGLLQSMWRKRDFKAGLPRWTGLVAAMAAGLAAGLIWTVWAGHIRAAHGSGAGGSEQWVFGDLAVRLSVKNWAILTVKELLLLFGPLGLAVPFLIVAAWRMGGGAANRLNRCMAFGLAGFAIHALTFIVLLLRHDYYIFGSGVFLIFALVCSLMVLVESTTAYWIRLIPAALVLSMVAGGLAYGTTKRNYRDYGVDQAIPALARVKEPGAVMTFGFDWSSRLPYAVHRKALMVTDNDMPDEQFSELLDRNREVPFAAMVVLGSETNRLVQFAANRLGFDTGHPIYFWPGGFILARPVEARRLLAENEGAGPDAAVFKDLALRVPPKASLKEGLVFWRLPFSHKPGSGFEVIIKRGGDAFCYRLAGNSLFRVRNYFGEP